MEKTSKVEILESPDKSPADKKDYRLIRFPNNELTALLISSGNVDKSVEKPAGVSLHIDVGGYHDTIPGLAHFVEHMIFMGSEKYPAENEFEKYITKFGGRYNASTENEATNFYFSVLEEGLDGSLDRFASLFKAPLMARDSINRERESVESEFQNRVNDDYIRLGQVLTALGQENHPSTSFVVGNSSTLKDNITDDELYNKVHEFQKKYYVGNRSYVCIQSQQSLDDLQDLVIKHFNEYPVSTIIIPPLSEKFNHKNAYKPEFSEKIFYVKPKDQIQCLVVTWCLPSYIKKYRAKSVNYVATILDDEGPGTLFSYLKKNLLATRISVAGELEKYSTHSLFMIYISLTEHGYNNVEQALDAIFSYLLLLETSGPSKEYYEKLQKFQMDEFKLHEERSALSNTNDLVPNMKNYSPKEIITGDMYLEYDEDESKSIIKELNQKNFNVMIVTNKYHNYDRKEKWFGVEYAAVDFPEKFNQLWENRTLKDYFSIPGKNPYTCSNYDIYYNKEEFKDNPAHPVKIMDNDYLECYYRLDDRFLLPNVGAKILFISPLVVSSLKTHVLAGVYEKVASHYLQETLYLLAEANYSARVTSNEKGFTWNVSGYNEKIDKVFDILIKNTIELPELMDEATINTILENKKRAYSNSILHYTTLADNIKKRIVNGKYHPIYKTHKEIDNITFDDLKEFAKNWTKELKLQCLFQGNILKSQVMNIVNKITYSLDPVPLKDMSIVNFRCRKIEQSKNFVRVKSFLQDDQNSVVSNYYQIGPVNLDLSAKTYLLCYILREPLFDTLRTQQQLGYSVSIKPDHFHKIMGIEVRVRCQETLNSAKYVQEKMEEFLQVTAKGVLNAFTDEEFNTTKSSIVKVMLKPDQDLDSEVYFNWSEVTQQEYLFDRRQKTAELTNTLSKNDLIEFFEKYFDKSSQHKLSVQVIGNSTDDPKNQESEIDFNKLQVLTDLESSDDINVIEDVEAFRNSLDLYPFVEKTF